MYVCASTVSVLMEGSRPLIHLLMFISEGTRPVEALSIWLIRVKVKKRVRQYIMYIYTFLHGADEVIQTYWLVVFDCTPNFLSHMLHSYGVSRRCTEVTCC